MKGLYNNFTDLTNPELKESLDRLYQAQNSISDRFRTKEITDRTTKLPVYLIQVKSAGRWTTVAAVGADGHLYLKATATTYDDFDSIGWNPSGD